MEDTGGFDFDRVTPAEPGPTKSARFQNDTRQPSPECDFYNCSRTKNLWPYEFDSKTLWFCWPHFRRYKNRPQPYKGRMKHHDFAQSRLERPDYTRTERGRHRDFVKRVTSLDGLGLICKARTPASSAGPPVSAGDGGPDSEDA